MTEGEEGAIADYLNALRERLGTALIEVWLFGSAARDDMWPDGHPIHSDIDIAVVTDDPIDPHVAEELVNATYPAFLACGRQLSPQWRTAAWMAAPPDAGAAAFVERLRSEGRRLL
jgi:predicted nucleotidyltransferase